MGQEQGLGDSPTSVPQSWCGALALPTHPTNPSEQSSKPGPTKAQTKTKPGCSTSQAPQRERVQPSATQSAVPFLTIDVDRLQLPILLHFHPLPPILNNPADRQTNRWTVKGHAARAPQQELQGRRPADGGKSVGARWAGTALTSWW